jgi:hypothetical protein
METYVCEGNAKFPRSFRGSIRSAEEKNATDLPANSAKLVRIRGLVARMAFQGLDANEIGYVRGKPTYKAYSARDCFNSREFSSPN